MLANFRFFSVKGEIIVTNIFNDRFNVKKRFSSRMVVARVFGIEARLLFWLFDSFDCAWRIACSLCFFLF